VSRALAFARAVAAHRSVVLTLMVAVAAAVGLGAAAATAATPARTPAPGKPPVPAPPQMAPPLAGVPSTTIAVPEYHQQHQLSCEESSLSMVLSFYGHPPASTSPSDQRAREDQILSYIGIDRTHWWAGPGSTETPAQQAVAGDPYVSFVGNPDGSEVIGAWSGYGTYYPNIVRAARQFGAPVARAGTGIAPQSLYDVVRAGHPVEVWVSFDLQAHGADHYTAFDGRSVLYHGPWEHTVVLSGIDATGVRINDPDRTQYWITFAQFETAYAQYRQMAVVFGSIGDMLAS
jgi:uncharacterized protein YvpB